MDGVLTAPATIVMYLQGLRIMDVTDRRPEYMTPAERVAQAKRLIPILEAEIAAGETRSMFFDLLAFQRKVLDNDGEM